MATQGLISAVKNDKVLYKIVVGCNGYTAPYLAKLLLQNNAQTASEALEYANSVCGVRGNDKCFGCKDCLTIQADYGLLIIHDDMDELTFQRHLDHFNEPKFNPRWECGLVAHCCIVNFDKGEVESYE